MQNYNMKIDFKRFNYAFFSNATKYLLVLTVLIAFHRFFELMANDYIVNPFFSTFNSSWVTITFFFVIVACIVIRFFYLLKYRYTPPANQLILLLISSIVYCLYRYTENTRVFYSVFWKIRYFDLLLVITLSELLLFVLSLIFKASSELVDKNKVVLNSFFLDKELNENDVDLLGREDLAKQIVSRIETTVTKSSFAIGVVGKWGSGKTSFLNLVNRNLTESKFIVIKFNPWNSTSAQSLISDFFDLVSTSLKKYDGSIDKKVNEYCQKVVDVNDTNFMRFLSLTTKMFLNNGTIEEKKDEINRVISGIGKRLIVFIDDIDRLDSNEVVEVIRLIRNTANFENTFFIVAYDRGYVNNAIKSITNYNSHFFLEKIFQLEIVLPVYEYQILGKVLFNYLKSSIPNEYHSSIEVAMFRNGTSTDMPMLGLIENIRDVTRFANSFVLTFETLKKDVIPYDLFKIECLKIKYPSVYTLLYEKRDFLFDITRNGNYTNENSYTLKIIGTVRDVDIDTSTVLEKILKESHASYGLSESECREVVQFISGIFSKSFLNDDTSLYTSRSIRYPKGFNRYFAQRLFVGQLSENDFSASFLLDQKEFNSKISEWVSKGLREEVRQKFFEIKEFSDKSEFEKIVNGIFYFGNIPSNGSVGDYQGFNDENLYEKLSDNNKKLSKKYYNGDASVYKTYLLSALKYVDLNHTSERDFASFLIKQEEIGLPISREDAYNLCFDFLKNYLLTKKDFTNFKFEYYNDCKWVTLNESGLLKIEMPLSAKTLMKTFIDNCFDSFLVRIIEESPYRENYFKVNTFMFEVYDTHNNFDLALSLKSESDFKYLSEFSVFYSLLKENLYKEIYFDFNLIPVLRRFQQTQV